MANKKRILLIEDMFLAIERGDLEALSIAIDELEKAEKSSWVRRGVSKIKSSGESSWTREVCGGKTAIGWIIEMKWLAAIKLIEPVSNLSRRCDKPSSEYEECAPAKKCAEGGWAEGLSIMLKRSGEKEKMDALRAACVTSNLGCVQMILDAGCPPMPIESMAKWTEDCPPPYRLSPLHAATWAGASDCVEALLRRGADPSKFACKLRDPSPIWMGLGPKSHHYPHFNWRSFFLLANSTMDKSTTGKVSWPISENSRTPFMEIMRNPDKLRDALAFQEDGMIGKNLLWKMAMAEPENIRDVEGKGWIHWANVATDDPASMTFKRKLLDKVGKGWSFSDQKAIIFAEESDSAGSASGKDSEIPPKSGGEESPLEKTQEPSPEDAMQMAIGQCLLEVSSMAAAMSSMSLAVENLERRMGERDAAEEATSPCHGAAKEASKNAISMMDKAESMRASLAAMAKMASMPKTASQRSMR